MMDILANASVAAKGVAHAAGSSLPEAAGTVPQWGLLAVALWGFWKALPGLIKALESFIAEWRKRNDEDRKTAADVAQKERDRVDAEFRRFERHLESADKRHEECQANLSRANDRINELSGQINKLQDTIRDMGKHMAANQASTYNLVTGRDTNPALVPLIKALDTVPGVTEEG